MSTNIEATGPVVALNLPKLNGPLLTYAQPARHLAASSRSASLWPATNRHAAGRRRRTPATSAPLASAPSARISAWR